jgi:hypothetical protein
MIINRNELEDKFDCKNAIFSAYEKNEETDDWDKVEDISNKIVVEGPVTFKYENVRSHVMANPTWMQVMKFFDKAIEETGDYHHIFLEAIEQVDDNLYEIVTGS